MNMKMKKLNKFLLLATIIIASLILGGFFYASQVNKQKSIERQQQIKIKQDDCKSLSAGVMKQWGNVMGVTYDDFWKECVVTYTDTETGKVKTAPLSHMKTTE